MFGDPSASKPTPLKGTYTLNVKSRLFEEDTNLESKLVMYGTVHGIAGTDHQRRDLMVALLWGTPIAISFGLIAAAGTTITTMTIAAIGVWYGGLLDSSIQRITEVNMILPVLPILIMIGTFYSRDIWIMLGAIMALSIFGAGIKSYRAIFIQVRTSGFIEAAQAYGAPNRRIVFRYLVPRVLPMVIPSLVILVPAGVRVP
jgi:peptide/nickel transport system permease protein